MDLTFQVSMQYCSLRYGPCFYHQSHPQLGIVFALALSSFFLEFFLYFSPVAYWAPTDLGSSPCSFISFWLFILFMGFSRQEYWSGLPFLLTTMGKLMMNTLKILFMWNYNVFGLKSNSHKLGVLFIKWNCSFWSFMGYLSLFCSLFPCFLITHIHPCMHTHTHTHTHTLFYKQYNYIMKMLMKEKYSS